MPAIRSGNLDRPDELRTFPLGRGGLIRLGSRTLGRGVLEPGWRWSSHMAPVMGRSSCPIHHVQLLLAGRFAVRMDDGEQAEFGPNDVFEIPPGHDAWVVGDEPAVLLDIAGNLDAIAVPQDHTRVATTLLMTDIVESTATAGRLGDAAWKQRLNDHNSIVRTQLVRFGGTEVDTTGDGFLATFASAAGALRCADAIRSSIRETGLEVRIGVHTGEIEVLDDGIAGISVHAAARIMSLAGASEVYASSLTRALAEGSGLAFQPRGPRAVKGLDEPIEVHELLP